MEGLLARQLIWDKFFGNYCSHYFFLVALATYVSGKHPLATKFLAA